MATLPKIFPNSFISQTGTWSPTTPSTISNGVLTPSGSLMVSGTNDSSTIRFGLTDMPSDFVRMNTLNFSLRYSVSSLVDDTEQLQFLLTASDLVTWIAGASVFVVTHTTSVGLTNILNVSFLNPSSSLDKQVWDGAVLHVITTHTKNKGADNSFWSIDEIELNGTYDTSPTVVLNSPANNAQEVALIPTFNFTGTDLDNDTIEYQIQVATTNTFNSDVLAFNPPTYIASIQSILNDATVNSSGLFVAIGRGTNATYSPIYATSTDGSTWTTPANMNGSTVHANMQCLAVNSSGLFVALGVDVNNYAVYATSTNGSNWTTPALMNGSVVWTPTSITVNSSGLFVAIGQVALNYPQYTTSTDGSTWTSPANMNGSTVYANMNCVTVNSSGLFVAVGRDTNTYPTYATSTDGSTWTTPALMNGSNVFAYLTKVTVNSSGLFVAVGRNNSNFPLYATSTNGSNWTTPALMNGSTVVVQIYALAVSPLGLFVALGNNATNRGVYATSTNGSNWTTPRHIDYTTYYLAVTAITVNSSGLFVAIGTGGGQVAAISTPYLSALIDAKSDYDVGFTAGHPFASGVQKSYTSQITLLNDTTYYWRVRGIDLLGSNIYGAWSTVRSFQSLVGVIVYVGILKRWNGSTWSKAKLMRWNGSAWVAPKLKRWDGSAWKYTDITGI